MNRNVKELNRTELIKFIKEHKKLKPRYEKLYNYYKGEHDILNRSKGQGLANNKIVVNFAGQITNTATGYLVGIPVTYSSNLNIERLTDSLDLMDTVSHDMDIAKFCSIYGNVFEMLYKNIDGGLSVTYISPTNAFIIYSDDVEKIPLFGVSYFYEKEKYRVEVYTATHLYRYIAEKSIDHLMLADTPTVHNIGELPIIEFVNNEEKQGDFEQVISLMDAYNVLQSDRVNDKEQFIDAVLVLKGVSLSDNSDIEAIKTLKKHKLLEMPEDAAAEYLTRQFDEGSVEILRKSLENDIYRDSGIPNLTDENFVGNASGVAMRYKLIDFEQKTQIKERYFTYGLKKRLKTILSFLNLKSGSKLKVSDIKIQFTRNLPVNEAELVKVVTELQGIVPNRILLGLLPFVDDIDYVMELIDREKKEQQTSMQDRFNSLEPIPEDDRGIE